MLRSRNKLTGETKANRPKKESDVPEATEGDCRECAFYRPPVSTGQSEDYRFMTDNFRMRPCGQGLCVGKKFMTRAELKKLQNGDPEPEPDTPPQPKPVKKKKPTKKKKTAKKKTGLAASGKPEGEVGAEE